MVEQQLVPAVADNWVGVVGSHSPVLQEEDIVAVAGEGIVVVDSPAVLAGIAVVDSPGELAGRMMAGPQEVGEHRSLLHDHSIVGFSRP